MEQLRRKYQETCREAFARMTYWQVLEEDHQYDLSSLRQSFHEDVQKRVGCKRRQETEAVLHAIIRSVCRKPTPQELDDC